jgi:hypothetical protein
MRKAIEFNRTSDGLMFLRITGNMLIFSTALAQALGARFTLCAGDRENEFILDNSTTHKTFFKIDTTQAQPRVMKSGPLVKHLIASGYAEGTRHFVANVNDELVLFPSL